MNRRHAIAQAHATHRLAVRLTSAHHAATRALEEERRLLAEKLDDPRNDIAHYKWLKACGALALALATLDWVVTEFSISSALAKELVS